MMTEAELNKHGIYIEIDIDRDFMPFRMPNTIEYATAYIVVNGHREYVDSTSGAWSVDTSRLRDEAIRKAQKYVKKGGAL